MDSWFFNQAKDATDCGWRCLYWILTHKKKSNVGYVTFVNWFLALAPLTTGMFVVDMLRLLTYWGIDYQLSFPTKSGTYLIFYPLDATVGHTVVYHNGKLFDPLESKPLKMSIETLQKRIETKFHPVYSSILMTIKLL